MHRDLIISILILLIQNVYLSHWNYHRIYIINPEMNSLYLLKIIFLKKEQKDVNCRFR